MINTDKSDKLFQRALQVAPGGVHSPVRSFKGMNRSPVFFQKAQGAYLWDVDGNQYIDFCQSFGPLMLGHRDPEVQEEVLKMIDTAWSFGACEPYSLELAEWLIEHLPFVEKVRFVSSGTEAVMSAMRVARGYTGKDKVIKFEGCYHGHVDSLLVKSGSGLAGLAEPSSAGISKAVAETTVVVPLDDEKELERAFVEHGKDVAALILEPLPANYGLIVQRKEFLLKAVELCKKHNVLLIFDEVISGFRVALGGMAEILDVEPDLVCYGKIIGGGFPVGCYGGRRELMDKVAPLGPVYQAGTLSANPVGMKAGLTTLKKMKRLNIWSVLEKRTSSFASEVSKLFPIDHFGSLFWIHSPVDKPIRKVSEIPAVQNLEFNQIFLKALQKGLYLAPNAYEVGFLSYAHDETILQKSLDILKQVKNEVQF